MNKLSNLLCLTGGEFRGHLKKGGLVSPNMGTVCRAHDLVTLAISNIGLLEQKLKNYFGKSSFATMLSFERCSETVPVKLHGR